MMDKCGNCLYWESNPDKTVCYDNYQMNISDHWGKCTKHVGEQYIIGNAFGSSQIRKIGFHQDGHWITYIEHCCMDGWKGRDGENND